MLLLLPTQSMSKLFDAQAATFFTDFRLTVTKFGK
jgi:hypothetical protein